MNLYSVLYVLNGLFPLAFLPFSSKVFHIHVEYTYTPQSRFICQLIPTIKIQRIICMIPFFFFPLYSFEALFVVTNPVHHLFQCVFCVCVLYCKFSSIRVFNSLVLYPSHNAVTMNKYQIVLHCECEYTSFILYVWYNRI